MAFIMDAAMGAGISELLKAVISVGKKSLNFKANLNSLQKTLESVKHIADDIEKLNRVMDRPKQETDQFIQQLNHGVCLVYKCSTISCWQIYKLYSYSIKLEKLDKSVIKFFSIQVQGFVAVNSLRNGVGIKEMNDKFDDFMLEFSNIKFKHTSAEVYGPMGGCSNWESFPGPTDGISFDTKLNQTYPAYHTRSREGKMYEDVMFPSQSRKTVVRFDPKLQSVSMGFAGKETVTGISDSIVGFDKPLQDLKEMLMQDKEPVTVISGPGGCGKTTLATMLCHDPEIKGIFGKRILFVTVSESANITAIVVKILKCQLPDHQLPDIQNDDDAIKHLECFLKQIGPSPILLVLDDVWPSFESLVDDVTFTLPNYKVLVTFRFFSPRFSYVSNLKSLDDQHGMTIFCLAQFPKDGTSTVPDNLVEKSHYWRPEVVWRREEKKWSGGESLYDTNRVFLDHLSTSSDSSGEMMKDISVKDCCMELGSITEDQRIPATTFMDRRTEWYSMGHKDMDTYNNLVEPSNRNLLDLVYPSRLSTYKININVHQSPMAGIQGKPKFTNAGKRTKADEKKPKTIQRNRPKIKISSGASQMRRSLPGVVIRETSSQVIPHKASQSEATPAEGEKGKEKVVYMPKEKALRPEEDNYCLNKDKSGSLLQELGGPLFSRAIFMPTPSHVQRSPTNVTSTSNWDSDCRAPPTPQPLQPSEPKQPTN